MSSSVEIKSFQDRTFDLLVVGAGIYGATLACAAARAGYDVALIDKGDYGEGASANSLKILHGGLRYLQSMDIVRMRQSIWARRDGFRQLPHLARPVPFIAPVGGKFTRSRAAYQAAAWMNDLISVDRNAGLPESHHIPRTRVISGDELKQRVPALSAHTRGALLWHDGLIENTERYTLSYVFSARDAGACIANYVKAEKLILNNRRVCGVVARDVDTEETVEIKAQLTINTTSGWRHDWSGETDAPGAAWVRAINIVTPRNWFGAHGVGLDNGERNLFFAPWRGGTMIGTMYAPFNGSPDNIRVTREDLTRFVDDVNAVYPDAGFHIDEISYVHAGLLPAKPNRNGAPSSICEERTLILNQPGYCVVQGVKYTTAAYWAERLLREISRQLGGRDTVYDHPRHRSVCGEHEEDVRHLTDYILRRTDMGTAFMPTPGMLESAAARMAQHLGWTEEHKRDEVKRVIAYYEQRGITRSVAWHTSAS